MVDSATLQAHSLFGGLSPEQMAVVKPLMGSATFNEGDIIIPEGTPNDSIYFIVDGRVAISRGGVRITELPEGQTFGEMELLDVMPSVATVSAVSAVRVVTISNRSIRAIYGSDTKAFGILMMNLARDLSRRLRRMDEIVCDTPVNREFARSASTVKPVDDPTLG